MPGNGKIFLAFLCLSLLSLFFILLSDEGEYRRDLSVRKAASYMEGFRVVSKQGGMDSLVITAARADFSKDETRARLDSVTMDIKKEGVLLNADRGTYNLDTRDLGLEDNVTIRTRDSVIRTNNLSWDPSRGMLTAQGKVRVEGSKFTVEGEGLAATDESKVRLMRNVKAIFR